MAENEQKEAQGKPNADEILSQHVGDLHYRVFRLKEYFDNLNDIIHYYLDKFGPYLPTKERTDLAILALEADQLFIELSELVYNIQVLRAHTQMHIDTNTLEGFAIPEEAVKELEKSAHEIEEKIYHFADHLSRFIEQITETARREGIA